MKLQFYRLCIVFILSLCCFNQAIGQWMDWESRSNNSIAEFDQFITDMKIRGYAPVNLSATMYAEEPRISSIWEKGDQNWACWYGMNQDALINKIRDFGNAGLAPIDITVYTGNGNALFAAIWRKSNYGTVVEARVSAPEIQNKIVEWSNKGYYPTDINGYFVDGQTFYCCVFNQQPAGIISCAFGKTEEQFQQEFNRLTPQGYYPRDVNYFNENGTVKCNGIWIKYDSPWDSRRGYQIEEFREYLNKKTNEGYRPVDVDQYYSDGVLYFGATLTKPKYKERNNHTFPGNYALPNTSGTQSTPDLQRNASILPIPPVMQQTKVWCWLATGEMIFRHLDIPNQNPSGFYQCGIIGTIFQNTICQSNCFNSACIRGSGSNANTVRMLKDYSWLTARKVFRCSEGYELPFSSIRSNIDSGKPILCGISPTRRQYYYGAEHVVLLIGYEQNGSDASIIINDPFPYPANENPYLRAGASMVRNYQYRISLKRFTENLFWHWSLSGLSLSQG